MAETVVYGYMLSIKWGDKLIKGLITSGLKLRENYEEVILKASSGIALDEFIDYDGEFSASGQTIERDPSEGSLAEVDTLTITAGATASGNVTITLNGVNTNVAVLNGDTIAQVATKIRDASYTGWTTGGTGDVITFTKDLFGLVSAPAFSGGTTGVTGNMIQTVIGQDATHEDYETLREAASVGAIVAFVYGRFTEGDKIVSGNAKITDYSEDANSKDRGSYNITFKTVKGSIIFSTFSTYPEVINDGNTVAWYIASELSTITKDGGNIVSRWNDYLESGRDLVTGSALWVNPDYIQFDGISQYLKCAGFTLIQPEFIYIIFKPVTWTNLDYIFDGNATNSGRVRQDTVTPRVIMSAGTDLGNCDDLVLNTWAIMRCRFDGANSKIQINESTAITGNCGIYNMSGFTLGSRGTVDARFSNIHVREIILRKIADDTEDETAIYNYLKSKYSL